MKTELGSWMLYLTEDNDRCNDRVHGKLSIHI